jgi:hypothetical protein
MLGGNLMTLLLLASLTTLFSIMPNEGRLLLNV